MKPRANSLIAMRGILSLMLAALIGGCAGKSSRFEDMRLHQMGTSERQWTGLAVAEDGGIFVNFPRWSDEVPVSVGYLRGDEVIPYPNEEWNAWEPGKDPVTHFVCVQALWIDDQGALWILDPANPKFEGVVAGGPKLIRAVPETGEFIRVYSVPEDIAPSNSYLNDVRIDTLRNMAYISDSGAGAIIVVDLESGEMRRLLDDHPSTESEDVVLTIGGKEWKRPDGSVPRVHADGIALSPDGKYLYYQALTGRTLYRVPVEALLDESLSAEELGAAVQTVGKTGAADGIMFGPDGNLYLSSLEHNAIRVVTPGRKLRTVVSGPEIRWPDSFAVGPQGDIYFTTSQIHYGANPPGPYKIFRISPLEMMED